MKRYETQLSGLDNRIEDIKANKIKFANDEEKRKAETENQDSLRRLSARYPYFAKAYAVSEGKPVNARIMVRGEPATPGPEVPRGFLTILGGAKVPPEETGSGRLELADWVTDAKNPLTARVMVNRIWHWHFGQGIVATPDDFGARGEAPTHPELLDYLASRFIEGGWSVKKLHRMILLSRTYQSASGNDPRNVLKDAKNAYLWKFNRRRLDAEEIRDSLLALSGNLDPAPGGEPPFTPEMTWKYTQHTAVHRRREGFRDQQAQRLPDAAAHPPAAVPRPLRWRRSQRGHRRPAVDDHRAAGALHDERPVLPRAGRRTRGARRYGLRERCRTPELRVPVCSTDALRRRMRCAMRGSFSARRGRRWAARTYRMTGRIARRWPR